jgi:hypothetical protein
MTVYSRAGLYAATCEVGGDAALEFHFGGAWAFVWADECMVNQSAAVAAVLSQLESHMPEPLVRSCVASYAADLAARAEPTR